MKNLYVKKELSGPKFCGETGAPLEQTATFWIYRPKNENELNDRFVAHIPTHYMSNDEAETLSNLFVAAPQMFELLKEVRLQLLNSFGSSIEEKCENQYDLTNKTCALLESLEQLQPTKAQPQEELTA